MSTGFGRVAPSDFRASKSGSLVRVVATAVAGLALVCAIAASTRQQDGAELLQAVAGATGKIAMDKAIMEHANKVAGVAPTHAVQTTQTAAAQPVHAKAAPAVQKDEPHFPAYPHESQAQRNAEAMAAAEAFQKERAQAATGHPVQSNAVAPKDTTMQRNEESMKAAQRFHQQHNLQAVAQQTGKLPAPVNMEESIAKQVENENEKTANAVVYTDSQADAEIDQIKKELKQRDRNFRQTVEKERHAEIAASVEAKMAPVHQQQMAQTSAKVHSLPSKSYDALYSKEQQAVEEARGKEARQKQQLIEQHLSNQVKAITDKAAAAAAVRANPRDAADDARSHAEEQQNSKHLQMEIAEITGKGLEHPMQAKPAQNAKSTRMAAAKEQELRQYMSSSAFKKTEALALKVEEDQAHQKP